MGREEHVADVGLKGCNGPTFPCRNFFTASASFPERKGRSYETSFGLHQNRTEQSTQSAEGCGLQSVGHEREGGCRQKSKVARIGSLGASDAAFMGNQTSYFRLSSVSASRLHSMARLSRVKSSQGELPLTRTSADWNHN